MPRKKLHPLLFITVSILIIGSLLVFVGTETTERSKDSGPAGSSAAESPVSDSANVKGSGSGNGNGEEEITLPYKNETVYVMLDHCGNIKDQRIVNRLYRSKDPETGQVKDFGSYTRVNNLTSEHKPELLHNGVLWDNSLLEKGDIYYEGITDNELPVEFGITYYLDGTEISAAELAGESGHLKIAITVRNKLRVEDPVSYINYGGNHTQKDDVNYVPLLVQGTYSADLQKFSDIKAKDAVGVVIGQSMDINFMAFPYPEEEIIISMQGEDIELNNIMMMIIPQLPPLPEVDMEEDLDAMLGGVSEMGDGLMQLYDGTGQMLKGMKRFRDEVDTMMNEINGAEGFPVDFAALRELTEFTELDISPDAIDGIITQVEELLLFIEQLPDADIFTDNIFSDNIFSDNIFTAAMREASNSEASSAENNPDSLFNRDNFTGELFPEEWRQFLQNSDDISSGLEDFLDSLILLRNLIDGLEGPAGNFTALLDSAEEMMEQITELPGALEEMVEGQAEIHRGIGEIHDRGILEMEKGLVDGINEMRFANAKIDKMKELAEEYRSYADNENNRNSSVQFVLQTEKIEQTGPDKTAKTEDTGGEEGFFRKLWQRFIALFDFSG